jgi:hypothetical protein
MEKHILNPSLKNLQAISKENGLTAERNHWTHEEISHRE